MLQWLDEKTAEIQLLAEGGEDATIDNCRLLLGFNLLVIAGFLLLVIG